MRPTFIDPDTKDYRITKNYNFLSADPHRGFRSYLPQSILNRLLLGESEEIEFIQMASSASARDAIVVDAGAGQCRYKKAFAHTRYIGLDNKVGDQTWDYRQLDIVADLLELPIKPESVDTILCLQVLEHIAEPHQFLCELHRILRTSGKLFLSVPQGFGEHQMPHDYFRFSAPGLEYVFTKAGFHVEFIRPMGGYFYFIGSWLKLMPTVLTEKLKNKFVKTLFQFPLKIIFDYLVPYLCFYLDRLDEGKGITILYGCCAKKT